MSPSPPRCRYAPMLPGLKGCRLPCPDSAGWLLPDPPASRRRTRSSSRHVPHRRRWFRNPRPSLRPWVMSSPPSIRSRPDEARRKAIPPAPTGRCSVQEAGCRRVESWSRDLAASANAGLHDSPIGAGSPEPASITDSRSEGDLAADDTTGKCGVTTNDAVGARDRSGREAIRCSVAETAMTRVTGCSGRGRPGASAAAVP